MWMRPRREENETDRERMRPRNKLKLAKKGQAGAKQDKESQVNSDVVSVSPTPLRHCCTHSHAL